MISDQAISRQVGIEPTDDPDAEPDRIPDGDEVGDGQMGWLLDDIEAETRPLPEFAATEYDG